ncbi:ATP-binding cassette domain-containing protein [Treponema ruminis]|uniref:UvrABC system protein A n=1 Tax=Treponema ruminis TaxID=744515 RepID=A0A7W8LL27_9SPIR|nr:ATP-binding cassette domain-containing protein [Treponema ruminis]MBB5225032.1 excinuclease ABC subunit A [Treponema ruminis]
MNGVENKESIIITDASENNLKHISLSIPLQTFNCVTGVSGCGKSSLVYDTIYAESQRAFLESMSGNMFGQKLMGKPKVESIENLRPAFNVSQNYYNFNPRSTVGTVSDISHYLRSLFALILSFEFKEKLTENFFSSNNPDNFCPVCKGLGEEFAVSEKLLIPDKTRKLKDGGILYYKGTKASLEHKLLMAICEKYNIDVEKQIDELSTDELHNLLYREEETVFHLSFKNIKGRYRQKDIRSKGAVTELKEKLSDIETPSTFAGIKKYLIKQKCSACQGSRFNDDNEKFKICGKSIAEVESISFFDLNNWLSKVFDEYKAGSLSEAVNPLLKQIEQRVALLLTLNVGYLTAARNIPSLSGGETQRVRIANQLNCPLKDIIYILDEPCKGLHWKNVDNIINATRNLVKKGNTVIAIEHNKQYISQAENIIELGPVGGPEGGYIISEGKKPSTNKYILSFKEEKAFSNFFELKNITFRNIKNQNVSFPIQGITCITGVSGSGKSTLISVVQECFDSKENVHCDYFDGSKKIKKSYFVNQKPIGKTPRSTVVSYLEIYDEIREIFAQTESAKRRGLGSGNFSINVNSGRCECCLGTGMQKIELKYLPDSYIVCPVCGGKRFSSQILQVQYKGKNISEILDSPIDGIADLFVEHKEIYEKILCMKNIGLGYIKLGQFSMNLSGGESQRIKLARALGSKSNAGNLYILDEPTSGLNETDIDKFKKIILELQKNGETIIMVEHNPEFIAAVADYIVDFGEKAGDEGGKIVSQGNTKSVFNSPQSSWAGLR